MVYNLRFKSHNYYLWPPSKTTAVAIRHMHPRLTYYVYQLHKIILFRYRIHKIQNIWTVPVIRYCLRALESTTRKVFMNT